MALEASGQRDELDVYQCAASFERRRDGHACKFKKKSRTIITGYLYSLCELICRIFRKVKLKKGAASRK
jgi:hypothetical protein